MDLLGSKPARGAYRTTWARMSLTALFLHSGDKSAEDVDKSIDRVMSAYWRLMDFLRIDLGIDPEDADMSDKYLQLSQAQADPTQGD